MKAYVLTEAQMKAYWALERRADRPDVRLALDAEVRAVSAANEAALDAPTDGSAAIAAERLTHPGRGWTAARDAEQVPDLIAAAVSYAFAADACVSLSHPLYLAGEQPPAPWPWGEHYWKPAPNARRNLEKAGALLVAAYDAAGERS